MSHSEESADKNLWMLKVLKLCKGHVEWTGYRMQWQRLHWEGRVRKTQHKKTDEAHWDIGTNRTRIPKTVQFQQKKHHWTNNLCRFDRFRNENAPPLTGNIEQLHLLHESVCHTHTRTSGGCIQAKYVANFCQFCLLKIRCSCFAKSVSIFPCLVW